MICSIRATGSEGKPTPGQRPGPPRRFATFHGLWGLMRSSSRSLLPPPQILTRPRAPRATSQVRDCRSLWKTKDLRTCHRFLRVVEPTMARITAPILRYGRQFIRTGSWCPYTALKLPQRRQAAPDQATVPTSAGAPRLPETGQPFPRRTIFLRTPVVSRKRIYPATTSASAAAAPLDAALITSRYQDGASLAREKNFFSDGLLDTVSDTIQR